MATQRRYVVAYDASDDAIRRRIRRACRSYGGWQQYSLFEMYLTDHQRAKLEAEFETIVTEAENRAAVKLYSVGPPKRDTTIGDDDDSCTSNVV